eukprot:4574898-Prymnesium_polylepis.2
MVIKSSATWSRLIGVRRTTRASEPGVSSRSTRNGLVSVSITTLTPSMIRNDCRRHRARAR